MAASFRQKIATIKAERDAAVDKADRLEARLQEEQGRCTEWDRELGEYERKIQMLEDDLDTAESEAKEVQIRAKAAEAEAEELEHRARRTNTLSGNDARRLSVITAKYNVAVKRSQDNAESIRELEELVQQLEGDLDMAEEREHEARRANSEYEAELRQLTENARLLGNQGSTLNERERLLERRVETLERKLAEEQKREEEVTRKEAFLEEEVDRADEELDKWKHDFQSLKEEYDQTMAELGEM